MAWFWTDDLARALLEDGAVDRSSVEDWLTRPVAVARPEEADPMAVARELLGIDAVESVGAA